MSTIFPFHSASLWKFCQSACFFLNANEFSIVIQIFISRLHTHTRHIVLHNEFRFSNDNGDFEREKLTAGVANCRRHISIDRRKTRRCVQVFPLTAGRRLIAVSTSGPLLKCVHNSVRNLSVSEGDTDRRVLRRLRLNFLLNK